MTKLLDNKYYDAQTNTSDVEEIRDLRQENYEGEVNNMDKDKENAQRSNLKEQIIHGVIRHLSIRDLLDTH